MSLFGRYWPQRVRAAEPLAAALLDHHRSGRPRRVRATRADGISFDIETAEYFTLEGALAPLDAQAIERCRGRVLDVGAGAGRHALALEARGLPVVAIDVSPICTQLCRERGVSQAETIDVMTLADDTRLGRFDTIFFGMQTLGVAGGVLPLGRLLERLRGSLAFGGEILADSSELRQAWEGDESDRTASRGEIVLSTRYRGWRGEPFAWLYLAEADLEAIAREAGFEMETLASVPGGEYLASLRPREGG
ncbi:MAG: methyltransferase [Deltaproteobacteria bacterium]|jgi:SAM-dependent methyltransferase|nr:methyltransferase [Deltaproteobacteria bacterium]